MKKSEKIKHFKEFFENETFMKGAISMSLKKVVTLFLIASMFLSYTACSRQAEPDIQNENSTQEEQSQEIQHPIESESGSNSLVIEENSDFDSSKQDEKSEKTSEEDNLTNEEDSTEEEPTKEELTELFDKAMYEINDLATEMPTFVVSQIFDHKMEFYYDDEIIIDNFPFVRTSKQYSELKEYYSQTFTGEALDWFMSTKFADVDGTLYCCIAGGATGFGSKAVSIEKLEGNTYQAIYENTYIDNSTEEKTTTFSVQKTDAGYRVSSIDYCPDLLDHKLLNERRAAE